MKLRYMVEEDGGHFDEQGVWVESWKPLKSTDRVHTKTADGIRIEHSAKKAYNYMNAVRRHGPAGRRLRVKKIEMA